jgi:hypothetical protein
MKKFSIFTVIIFVSTLLISPSDAADQNKYSWPPDYNGFTEISSGKVLGYSFSIFDDFTQGAGSMEGHSFISVMGKMQPLCTGLTDPICINEIENNKGQWWMNVSLAPCKDLNQESACIETIRLEDSPGIYRDLTFKKMIPGNYWPENKKIGLPEGGAPSLWIDPKETNPDKGFLVSVGGAMGTGSQGSAASSIKVQSLQASIAPYETLKDGNSNGLSIEMTNGVRKFMGHSQPYCIWADTGECGVQGEFPKDANLQMVLHLPNDVATWLLGRMREPVISIKNISNSVSRVEISGTAVEIPMISDKVKIEDATPDITKLFNTGYFEVNPGYQGRNFASSYENTFEVFNLFKGQLSNNAKLMLPRWSIRSIQSVTREFSQCKIPGKFQGVVTTNAAIYQGSPPAFDGESFDYKVAGVHNTPSGEVFKGSYDLALEADFARCLYKFTSAPIRASVSITNEEGVSNVATTSFTEKNGWLKLSANGFTFSSPKINIKLEQDKSIQVPAAVATTTKKNTRWVMITCKKKSSVLKISGKSPLCPAGYKKQ